MYNRSDVRKIWRLAVVFFTSLYNVTKNKKSDAMRMSFYRVLVVGRRFAHNHENRVVFALSVLTLLGIADLLLLIAGEFLTM